MRSLRHCIAVAISACGVTLASRLPKLDVQKIDISNLPESEPILLLFSSTSCERCHIQAEDLVRVENETVEALKSRGMDSKLRIFEVDVHEHEDLARKLAVEGVPTVSLVKGQNAHEYGGSIEKTALSDWLHRRLRPPAIELKTEKDITEFEKWHDVAIVAYIESKDRKNFERLIEPLRDIPDFGIVIVNEGADQKFQDKLGLVEISKYGLKEKIIYKMPKDFAGVQEWLIENQLPLMGEINLSNLFSYLHNIKPFVWFVGLEEEYKVVRDKLIDRVIRKDEFYNKYRFVWVNPLYSKQNLEFIEQQLKTKRKPGFLITDLDGPGRYLLDKPYEEIEAEDIADFIRDCVAHKVPRVMLSDPIPEKHTSVVETVVTDTVEEFVRRGTQLAEEKGIPDNVLIVDSAWCSDCKTLASNVAQLVVKLRNEGVDNTCLRVGLLSGYTNEINPDWGFGITRFPTMWMFPGGCRTCIKKANLNKNTPLADFPRVEYASQEIDEKTIIEFLKKHAKCHALRDAPYPGADKSTDSPKDAEYLPQGKKKSEEL